MKAIVWFASKPQDVVNRAIGGAQALFTTLSHIFIDELTPLFCHSNDLLVLLAGESIDTYGDRARVHVCKDHNKAS